MTLTQQAVYGDLQGFLDLTSTQLANATATAFLAAGFARMNALFGNYWFDNSTNANKALQKQGEIFIGAFYYLEAFCGQKELDAGNVAGNFEGSIRFGGMSVASTETNQARRIGNLDKLRGGYFRGYNEICNTLINLGSVGRGYGKHAFL